MDDDRPDHAELTSVSFEESENKLILNGVVSYFAPARLSHSPECFLKAKRKVESVIRAFPNASFAC